MSLEISEKTIDSYLGWVKLITTLNSLFIAGIIFKISKTDIFDGYIWFVQCAVALNIISIVSFLIFSAAIIEHKNKGSSQENKPTAVGPIATISLFFAFFTFLIAIVMTSFALVPR